MPTQELLEAKDYLGPRKKKSGSLHAMLWVSRNAKEHMARIDPAVAILVALLIVRVGVLILKDGVMQVAHFVNLFMPDSP